MSNFIVIDYVMFCFACFIDVHIGKFVSRIEKWLTSALLAFLYLPNYLPTYLPRYNFERNRCGAEFCFCVLLILCLVRLRSNAK